MCLVLGLALRVTGYAAPNDAEPKQLKGYDANGGEGRRIVTIPIDEDIDPGLAAFVDRTFSDMQPNDVAVLIVKTFGGRIDSAVQIRDRLLKSKVPTVAFIDERAISAGALISLACDTIIMTPSATLGAAAPVLIGDDGKMTNVDAKVISYMRAEMKATAEAKGRRGDIAEAMVDAALEIKDIDDKDHILTLTTDKALELGFANAKADDFEAAIKTLNLVKAPREDRKTAPAERFARFITDGAVASILMTLGIMALFFELGHPGTAIGGIIAVVCFALFFGGQYAASLAGWEELVVFGIGILLLALEVLVLPGFGVAGIAGIAAIIVAFVMATVELEIPWDVSLELGYVQEMIKAAALRIVLGLVALVASLVIFVRFFGRTRLGRQLVLQTATASSEGYVAKQPSELVGKRGEVVTTLRPSGIAMIEGARMDVVSLGDFIERGASVEVIRVDGNRIVVRAVT